MTARAVRISLCLLLLAVAPAFAWMAGEVAALHPASANTPASGGWGSVSVTPAAWGDTTWQIAGQPDWLTVIRLGDRFVWKARPNPGSATRTAVLKAGSGFGQVFSLTQAGTPGGWPVQAFSGGGSNRTRVLAADGGLWEWGDGATAPRRVPDSLQTAWVNRGWNPYLTGFADGTIRVLQDTSQLVGGVSNVISAASGCNFHLAVRADGALWSWGANSFGQLGLGSYTDAPEPRQVSSLTGVQEVSASCNAGLALLQDGTVWGWGSNSYGKTVPGGAANLPAPVRIQALSGVVAVRAAASKSYALKWDGTLWQWGSGVSGVAQVAGIADVVDVAIGGNHVLALTADGRVWAWGTNTVGQLGNGSTSSASAPVLVPGLSGVQAIAAGAWHSLALTYSGVLYGWGGNTSGQLADGTKTNRYSPSSAGEIRPAGIAKLDGDGQSMRTFELLDRPLIVKVFTSGGAAAVGVPVTFQAPASGASGTFPGNALTATVQTDENGLAATPAFRANGLAGAYAVLASASGFQASFQVVNGTGQVVGVSPSAVSVDAFGGWGRVTLTPVAAGDRTYEVTGAPNWLRFVRGANWLVWRAAANPSSASRTATVAVGMPPHSVNLTVTQQGASGSGMVRVSAGASQTLAISSSAQPWAWGQDWGPAFGPVPQWLSNQPATAEVEASEGSVLVHASGTVSATTLSGILPVTGYSNGIAAAGLCVLLADGTVWQSPSQQVAGLSRIVAIAGGSGLMLALRDDGSVWSWGTGPPERITSLPEAVAIAAGDGFGLALREDGTVWSWGVNASGQLGDGTKTGRDSPAAVTGLIGVARIAAGASHSIAILSDGSVRSWGVNSSGQLGLGTTNAALVPSVVTGVSDVVECDAGRAHTVCLLRSGHIAAWGNNSAGQLGDGTLATRLAPTPVVGLAAQTLTKVLGDAQSARVGSAFRQRFHVRVTNASGSPVPGLAVNFSAPSSGPSGTFSPGGFSASVITGPDGLAAAPSFSANGTPGAYQVTATCGDLSVTFSAMNGTGDVAAVSATSISVPDEGGLGSVTVTPLMTGDQSWSISGQPLWLMVWKDAGRLWYRAQPNPNPTSRTASLTVGGSAMKKTITLQQAASDGWGVRQMSLGGKHGIALMGDGTVRTWGAGNYGQLGHNSFSSSASAVQAIGISGIVAVAAGEHHVLALKQDGTVWSWGRNQSGQLGDGTTQDRATPTQVAGLLNIVWIAAGEQHSLAVQSDGTLWAWGANSFGQLGNGSTAPSSRPVPSLLTEVRQVESRWRHSLAILQDGTVWAWGTNEWGQLGDGTTQLRTVPVLAPGASRMQEIAAGTTHSMALDLDGSVWSWGGNYAGQLGDGANKMRLAPGPLGALTSVQGIAAGADFSLAWRSDGSGWSWGANASGQLGHGSTNPGISAPSRISALSNLIQMAAGSAHAAGVSGDMKVRTWGANGSGECGDGSTTGPRLSPALAANLGDYTFAPSVLTPGPSSGNASISLSVRPPGSPWFGSTSAAWLSTNLVSGAGNATIALNWTANASAAPRSGLLTIAGQSTTVQQAGSSAQFSFSPGSVNVEANAGSVAVSLNVPAADSPWSAVSSASWLSAMPAAGSGPATLVVQWSANGGALSRTGTVTAGGATFRVTQSATPSVFAVSTQLLSASGVAGSQQINVTTSPSDAAWTASSQTSWLSVSPSSGKGAGTVRVTWSSNLTSTARTGRVLIAGHLVEVRQSGSVIRKTLIGVYDKGGWAMDLNGNGVFDGHSGDWFAVFGTPEYEAVPGDWGGTGKISMGIYRTGFWYLDTSANRRWDGELVDRFANFGAPGYRPTAGDWDGDGRTQIGICKDGEWYIDLDGDYWFTGADVTGTLGGVGFLPVVGDWNGDGKSDIGAYKDGVWYLDMNSNFQYDGPGVDRMVTFGAAGFVPVTGDWNGDGKTDLGVFRNGEWRIDFNGNLQWDGQGPDKLIASFGGPGSTPLVGDWNGTGRSKIGIFSYGQWYLDTDGDYQFTSADKMYWFGMAGQVPITGHW